MFDVIWTDHNRELIGERKARKEVEKQYGKRDDNASVQGSNSTRSSSSLALEHGSGRSSSATYGTRNAAPAKVKTAAASSLHSSSIDPKKKRTSSIIPHTGTSHSQNEPQKDASGTRRHAYPGGSIKSPEQPDVSSDRASKGFLESLFSKLTDRTQSTLSTAADDSTTHSEWGSGQQFGAEAPSSFVTRETTVSVEPAGAQDLDVLVSEISIGRGPPLVYTGRPLSPTERPASGLAFQHVPDLPSSPPQTRPCMAQSSGTPVRRDSARRHASLRLSQRLPQTSEMWKAPEAWDRVPPEPKPRSLDDMVSPSGSEDAHPMAMDLAGLQREVKRMACANPRIVLLRLTEDWGASSEESINKEIEMDKKRWMLSALNMDLIDTTETNATAEDDKILALFETQATASYLAAIHPRSPVYHLSQEPISHQLFPNIRPIKTPTVSASALSVAPEHFARAYCLSLPSLLPSAEIPAFLRAIHRSLVPDGTVHLILIDALPVASSMGPAMRAWFEENLQLNLERQFRCLNPTKLFPSWLSEAHLRADGSNISTIKFLAYYPKRRGEFTGDESGSPRSSRNEKDIQTEMRATVGRMLWKEVWGKFATASKWFWEDVNCTKECRRFGTYWQYQIIEGVKRTGT